MRRGGAGMSARKAMSFLVGKGAKQALLQDALAWQAAADLVTIGGISESSFGMESSVKGPYTYIAPSIGINTNSEIRQVAILVRYRATEIWKLKVFRWNGTTFDFVSEAEIATTAPGNDIQTFDISPALAVQRGDFVAVYVPTINDGIQVGGNTGNTAATRLRQNDGDWSSSSTFTEYGSAYYNFDVDVRGPRPYLVLCGDSISDGNTRYFGLYATQVNPVPYHPGGALAGAMCHQIESDLPGLKMQTVGRGSQTLAWGLSFGVPTALTLLPHTLILEFGTNDIGTGRTWEQYAADLDAIKVLFDASSSERLMICEILPATSASDANSALIRTWNGNLATWCTTNGATLIRCHDAMGKTRTSTGEIDDLKSEFNQDGVHLSPAGAEVFASIIVMYL